MKRKDCIDEMISKGAFVLPPKKAVETVVAEPELVPELIPSPVQIESVAEALSKCWRESIPDRVIPATEYAEYEESPEPKIGDVCDLVVVAWSTFDPTGLNRDRYGLARIPGGSRKKGSRDGFHFKEVDITSEGIETLRPGSKIRGRLAEPISSAHPFTVVDIEIYK